MQISINDLGHVIRILLIKLIRPNVLTIECLRGLSIESKVHEWSRACVQVYIGQISNSLSPRHSYVYGCSYIGSFTSEGIFAFSVYTKIIMLAYSTLQKPSYIISSRFVFAKPFTRILIQFSCTVFMPFMYSKVLSVFIRFNDCTKMFHKMYMNIAKIQYRRKKINIQETIQDSYFV